MSHPTSASQDAAATDDGAESPSFTRDAILEMLSNQRRRFVIHALKQYDEPVSVSELAEQVASWEYDKPVEELGHRERKRVRNALRQFHLSKMADYGFIEYDQHRGLVSLSDRAQDEDFYVDSLTGGDVPWGLYYLGFSGVSTIFITGVVVGIPPLSWVSPTIAGVCIVAALLVSSLGHFYDNYYRIRLGAREEPAEVRER